MSLRPSTTVGPSSLSCAPLHHVRILPTSHSSSGSPPPRLLSILELSSCSGAAGLALAMALVSAMSKALSMASMLSRLWLVSVVLTSSTWLVQLHQRMDGHGRAHGGPAAARPRRQRAGERSRAPRRLRMLNERRPLSLDHSQVNGGAGAALVGEVAGGVTRGEEGRGLCLDDDDRW